jgi:bifunctional UDP-N-acetylglucosamine pyrophosphorylase/glucosamine-1-phosphate N-acetyltransferase
MGPLIISKKNVLLPSNASGKSSNLDLSQHFFNPLAPWEILDIAEKLLSNEIPYIHPTARIESGVEIEGNVFIDEGVSIMRGSKLSGNIYVGTNTFIANSTLIRGNTSIGKDSVIAFGADIKNVVAGGSFRVGPLSFIGDSIVQDNCFFGGMVRVSNYRLDGKDVSVKIGDELVSTGRRQFGTITEANCSVGIACIILPEKKNKKNCLIGPQVIVRENIPSNTRVMVEQTLHKTKI